MKTGNFRQELSFKASPDVLFELIADSRKHGKVTGDSASVSKEEGGDFSAFGGLLHGKVLKRVEGNKIVLAWRSREKDWPEGHFSRVAITLDSMGKNKTRLKLYHSKVPEACIENVKTGWYTYYWGPMRAFLKARA